jgi:hypothetical protein
LIVCLVNPAATRTTALLVQGFALLGVCVGFVTIAVNVGPCTAPDLVLHALMLLTPIIGLLAARRAAAT